MDTLNVENAKSLVNAVEQRRQHLSSTIHNLNLVAVTLVAGVWTFFLDGFLDHSPFINPNISEANAHPFAFSYIIMAAGISSLIMMLWRLYARYLDNQISALYPEIMRYEKRLGVSGEDGICNYLARSNKILERVLRKLGETQQVELVRQLFRGGRIGRRETLIIDYLVIIAMVLFIGLAIIDVIFLNKNEQLKELFIFCDINRIPIIMSKLLGYLAIVGSLGIHLYVMFCRFQRNPKDKHVNKILASLESAEQNEKS